MPKKKKKDGGKGKGKATRKVKEKKEPEPTITMREAMLAFQLKVKERAVEEFADEVEALEYKNERQGDRNRKLKEEQEEHLRKLLVQAEERSRLERRERVVESQEVEDALLDKFATRRENDGKIAELKAKARALQEAIDQTRAEVDDLTYFKNNILEGNSAVISDLEERLKRPELETEQLGVEIEEKLAKSEQTARGLVEKATLRQQETSDQLLYSKLSPQAREEADATARLLARISDYEQYRVQLQEDIGSLKDRSLEMAARNFDLAHSPLARRRHHPNSFLIDFKNVAPSSQPSAALVASGRIEVDQLSFIENDCTPAIRGHLLPIQEGKKGFEEPAEDKYRPNISAGMELMRLSEAQLDADEAVPKNRCVIVNQPYCLPPITKDTVRQMLGSHRQRSSTVAEPRTTEPQQPTGTRHHARTRTK